MYISLSYAAFIQLLNGLYVQTILSFTITFGKSINGGFSEVPNEIQIRLTKVTFDHLIINLKGVFEHGTS